MSSCRAISRLVWAGVTERPGNIPLSRSRGRKAAGLRYERELAKALPGALHGQWFRFVDRNGPGHCQTDIILDLGSSLLILEAKYTWTEAGHRQIEKLYRPVVSLALQQRAFGMVVCKVLTNEPPKAWICRSLDEAKDRALKGLPTVLHWLGTALGPLQQAPPVRPLASEFASL